MIENTPDKQTLNIGHAFFDCWSHASLLGKVQLFALVWTRPRKFRCRAHMGTLSKSNLTTIENHSYRIRIGRIIQSASTSFLQQIRLPFSLLALSIRYFFDRILSKRFSDIDIGLVDDPLRISAVRKGGKSRVKERRQTLLAMLQDLDTASNPEISRLEPRRTANENFLYVGAMPFSDSPSGYNIRTKQICDYLVSKGYRPRKLYVAYNRTMQHERKNSPEDITFKSTLGFDGNLDTMIKLTVEKIIVEAQSSNATFIVAGSNWLNGYCSWLAARNLSLHFIYDARGLWHATRSYIDPKFKKSWAYDFQRRAEFSVMRAADHVFAISTALKKMGLSKGIDENRISVVPNMLMYNGAVSSKEEEEEVKSVALLRQKLLREEPDAILIAYAGSITPYERLDIILKTLSLSTEVGTKQRNLKFAIAGAGTHQPYLERLASELGVNENVIWLGSCSRSFTHKLIRAADFMVYPRAKHEAFQIVPPLKPLEPMFLGTACIMSNIYPHRDLAGHNNARALILYSDNPINWLEAIYDLQDNSKAYRTMVNAAQRWVVETRNPENIMRPWIELIESLKP